MQIYVPFLAAPPIWLYVNYELFDVGGRTIITGTVSGGTAGYVVGTVETSAIPEVPGVITTPFGNSCWEKTSTVFIMMGRLALVTAA